VGPSSFPAVPGEFLEAGPRWDLATAMASGHGPREGFGSAHQSHPSRSPSLRCRGSCGSAVQFAW
jgi:hypothetical protein